MKPLIVLFLILLPFVSHAETVDLTQALNDAIKRRPMALAARDEARAANSGAIEARSRLLPNISLTEKALRTDEPGGSLFISLNQEDLQLSNSASAYNYPPARTDFETRVTLQQSLYDPDAWFGLKRAEADARTADAMARWTDDEAAFAAFRAYLGVQQAQAAEAWAEAARREAQENLRLAEQRRAAGLGLKAEALQAQVALAEAERNQFTTNNDIILARRSLALAMGRPELEVEIAAPLKAALFAPTRMDGSMQRADLEALASRAEAASLAHRQSRADWLPRASLAASYALHDGDTPFGGEAGAWSLQAGLQWELFDGLRRQGASARTAAQTRAARNHALEANRQSQFALEQARRRAEEAQLKLSSARRAVVQASESRRLTLQRYEAGLSPLVDLLTAQTLLDRTRYAELNAETGHILALGDILFQQGRFLTLLTDKENQP